MIDRSIMSQEELDAGKAAELQIWAWLINNSDQLELEDEDDG